MVAALRSDFHFALRQLRKSRGFALTSILTLAVGIGSTTTIYSLIDGVLLKPLALPHPEQLVAVYSVESRPGQTPTRTTTSYPNYVDWRDRSQSFAQLAAYVSDVRLISRDDGTGGVVSPIGRITANYFNTLGVQPMLGRNFSKDDDQPGHHVVILSYGLWKRLFASNREILGTTLMVSDAPCTIVGVMPKGFIEPRSDSQPELWTSFAPLLDGSAPRAKERDNGFAEIVGRLKTDTTEAEASADLAAIQSSLAQSYPEDRYINSVFVQSKLSDITGDLKPPLLMLMSAVLAVLLIACSNVAGLMLIRTIRRRGEISLRTALGASPFRVWQQLLIESSVLGVEGGSIGVLLAYTLLHIALPFVPEDIPRISEVTINGRVLALSAALSIVCSILSSLFPTRMLTRVAPIESLREQKQTSGGNRSHTVRDTLVVAQIAIGFVLLLASGLLIRGFVNVRHAKTGFRSDHLFRFQLPLTNARYPDARKAIFYEELLPKLAAIPGVHSASAGHPLPLQGYNSAPLEIDGITTPPDRRMFTLVGVAQPGFFETLGVPLLKGRNFTTADNDPRSPFVAIVNQAFATKYFPDQNPIGRHIRPDLTERRNQSNDLDPTIRNEREIIGVIADFQQTSVMDKPQPLAVFPYAQASMLMRPTFVLRVAGDPMQYEKSAQSVVYSVDPLLFLLQPQSMEMHIGDISSTQRFETLLVSGFASIALFLCGLGLYATLAAMVGTRTHEIGVRIAVGAGRREVASLVFARTAALFCPGIAIGALITVFAFPIFVRAEWCRQLLFGVSWFEPQTYSIALLVLGGASFLACCLPTWRAVSIDPIRVLRDE